MTGDTLTISSRVRFRAVGDDGVLVHLDSGRVVVVNGVGLFLVEQLQQPRTRAELAHAITDTFDVGATEAETDLAAYLDDLAAEDMLQAAAAG